MSKQVHHTECLVSAAKLLVDIAGLEPVHIEMSARGPKKYYDVHRPLDERDARAHLLGYRTKGAMLRHPDGWTRALCYDADTPDDWQRLLETARLLSAHGYLPLLEVSPVGRGGHCWIIYRAQVKASWAQRQVQTLAPMLGEITEYWPGPGNHKVRLPAGRYVQPGFAAWCTLTDAHGTLLSTNGTSAAHALLDYQTPAELVPQAPLEGDAVGHDVERARVDSKQEVQAQTRAAVVLGQVDQQWHQQYKQSALWFQFTPRQLAALYNERYSLSDMLPLENNGMAFSPSVQERTPSTAITKDGLAWVDFSARARLSNGKHDGGDALELAARRNGESKTAKSATLREAARFVVQEARDAMESAGRAGDEPPAWVVSIMTEAGWQRYRSLRAEAQHVTNEHASPAWGVAGFTHAGMTTQAAPEPITPGATQPLNPAQAVPHESGQRQDSVEALAADLGSEIGEPCSRCGCTLFYQSGPYRMCHLCYPRPAKFGRLTDEQWQRLRALFPRTSVPLSTYRRKR